MTSTTPAREPAKTDTPPEPDFYVENGRYVFTAAFLVRRGSCCGSGCRHCPYQEEARPADPPGQSRRR